MATKIPEKKTEKLQSVKTILSRNLAMVTIIAVVLITAAMILVQLLYAQEKAVDDANDRFVQIHHLIEDNRADRMEVQDDLERKYLRNAHIAAFIIQNHPELLEDPDEMKRIASVLEVDEINIFDETGRLYAGTHPEYFGMSFDSGEQMAFFKPMLEDKSLELCQDLTQNIYDGRMMQYVAVWSDNGSFIAEVGKVAEDTAALMEKYDLSYIFSMLRVNSEAELYAANSETGEIMGATITEDIGKSLSDIGIELDRIKREKKGFHTEVNGEKCYCVFAAEGVVLLGRIIPNREIYKHIIPRTLEFVMILLLVVAGLIYALIKYMDLLVIRNVQSINKKLLNITEGYLEERVEPGNSLEFFQLGQYINEMVESLADRMEQRERLFNIVAQHSNRILYSYDLASGTTRLWSENGEGEDILAHIYSGEYSEEGIKDNEAILPDCAEDVKAFFESIYKGVPEGEANVHILLENGQKKWYSFMYSAIFDGDRPVTALISIEDITEDHERELARRRFMQAAQSDVENSISYLEVDLTMDMIEKHTGQELWSKELSAGKAYSQFVDGYMLGTDEEENEKLRNVYGLKTLLSEYEAGTRNMEHIWKMQKGMDIIWIQAKTELAEDPYSRHIKLYTTMTDVTEQQEEQQQIKRRADYDAMTGLLRREVGEQQIKEYLAEDHRESCILIILDMDDLKGINDELGHKTGDEAIAGIAGVMREHFSEDDILIRAGGDEFIAFMKNVGHGEENVGYYIGELLQKMSAISVGEKGERSIHCSAGCAMTSAGAESYDDMFSHADLALYHVKRNGKNTFAFYTPEMKQENYEFRSKKLLSMRSSSKFEMTEMQHLLDSIANFYELVLSVNVSANTYHIMEEVKNGVFAAVPDFGVLDDFVVMSGAVVHPDDRDLFYEKLSRKALMEAYERGENRVHCVFRFQLQGQLRNVECMVNFYTDEKGDVRDFTMIRWDD